MFAGRLVREAIDGLGFRVSGGPKVSLLALGWLRCTEVAGARLV